MSRLLLIEVPNSYVRYGVDENGNWWHSAFVKDNWRPVYPMMGITQRVLEEFMEVKPSLEYLHGYTVKEVLVPEGGHQWGIEFQNGAIVYNDDPEMSAPATNIEGLSLITTMYGAEDTRMRLGRMTEKNGEMTVVDDTMISLTPLKYTIIDPRFDGVPHTPQDAATEDADEMTLSIREQFNANTQEAPEPGSPGTEEVIEEEVTPES